MVKKVVELTRYQMLGPIFQVYFKGFVNSFFMKYVIISFKDGHRLLSFIDNSNSVQGIGFIKLCLPWVEQNPTTLWMKADGSRQSYYRWSVIGPHFKPFTVIACTEWPCNILSLYAIFFFYFCYFGEKLQAGEIFFDKTVME